MSALWPGSRDRAWPHDDPFLEPEPVTDWAPEASPRALLELGPGSLVDRAT